VRTKIRGRYVIVWSESPSQVVVRKIMES